MSAKTKVEDYLSVFALDLNMKMLQQYGKYTRRTSDGSRRILRNNPVHPDGFNIYCSTINLPICILWQGRRSNKRLTLFILYFLLHRLFIIKNMGMLIIVRIKLIKISQPASGPEPKTIGIGPIKIIPRTLPDPPKNRDATTKTAIPTKTKDIPKSKKPNNRSDMLIASFSGFSSFTVALPQ
jgi:hypothetical protein